MLKRNDGLFIHDDSALQNSRMCDLVKEILLEAAQTQEMFIVFTQSSPLVLSDIVGHRIFLTRKGLEMEELGDQKGEKTRQRLRPL